MRKQEADISLLLLHYDIVRRMMVGAITDSVSDEQKDILIVSLRAVNAYCQRTIPKFESKQRQSINLQKSTERWQRKVKAYNSIVAVKVEKEIEEIFDTIKIRGKAIGNIWYHELPDYKILGEFEASLCDALLQFATPTKECLVRDLISAKHLKKLVNEARNKNT